MPIAHSLVDTDWTIDRQTGDIRYIGHDHNGVSPSYATVIEFHRWVQSLSDDEYPAAVDDELDISALLPSQRSTDNIITLINGYNVDDGAVEHLYDGSIIQDGGDTIYDGIINFGNTNVQIQIIQDGSVVVDDYWNYNLGGTADSGSGTTLTDTGAFAGLSLEGSTVLNVTDPCQGLVLSHTDNILTFASGQLHGSGNEDFDTSDAYLIGQPLNPNAVQGVSHRFMIKTRVNGVDIDGRRLIGVCRRFGNTYGEFKINGTSRGNNVLALSDTADLNNTTAPQTVGGTTWDTDFSNTGGLRLIDVDQDTVDEEYYSEWTWSGTHTINDLYERIKIETEDVRTTNIDGHVMPGNVFRGITHSFPFSGTGADLDDNDLIVWGTAIVYSGGTGTYNVGEAIIDDASTPAWKGRIVAIDDNTGTGTLIVAIESGGTVTDAETFTCTGAGVGTVNGTPTAVTGGGTLHCLAVDDDGGTGNLYVQVRKGTAPPDSGTIYDAGTDASAIDVADNLALTAAPTDRTVSTPAAGVSTGSAIIGAYGLGVAWTKLSSSDKLFDLSDTPITPPNNVTNTVVLGVDYSDDRVMVAPWDGLTLDTNGDPTVGISGMTLQLALTTDDITEVEVNEDLSDAEILAFLPASGYLQVKDDGGVIRRLEYSGHDSIDTFTITTSTGDEDFLGDEAAVGNSVSVGQMHLVTALSGGAEVAAVVNNIPGSTPNSGTLRIVNDEGFHIRVPYSVYDDGTDTFTITSSDWSGSGLTDSAMIGNHAYVTYLDLTAVASFASFQAVYDNDLNLVVVVRDGATTPIKQFISSWSFGDSANSISVIKTTDA